MARAVDRRRASRQRRVGAAFGADGQTIFADYARIFPSRFSNVTNGVTPRRWLAQANPALAALLDRRLGARLATRPGAPARAGAARRRSAVSQRVPGRQAQQQAPPGRAIRRELGLHVDPDSLFDVQVKRIHEYKRQLLNVLHVVTRYQAMLAEPERDWVPRTVIFAGKAASAYIDGQADHPADPRRRAGRQQRSARCAAG